MERKTGSSKGWRSVNHQHGNYQEWESLPLNLYLLELPPKAGFLMSAHHIFSCVSIRYLWYWFLFSLSSSARKLSIAGFNIKLFFKTLVTAICNIQMLFLNKFVVVVVQSLKHVWHFVTPWTAAHRASPSFTISQNLLSLMSIELVMPSNHLVLCCHLLLLPSIFPSIRVFSNELVLHIRWSKYWSSSFSISPSNEYSGLISFRMDWLDLLAALGTLKSLLQHHSSKASILQHSTFFKVQLSHPYMTTGKL